jgi:hypothetical protein
MAKITVLSNSTARYQLLTRMLYSLPNAENSQRSPEGGNGIAHFLFARFFHLFTDLVQVLLWRRDVELAHTNSGGEGKVEIA